MNILTPQINPTLGQWQAEIKLFAKKEKYILRKNILPMNCSNHAKLTLLKSLKETLKIKLQQVSNQKHTFEQKITTKTIDPFTFVSEKDYLVISGRCLNDVDQLQFQLLKKLQTLISQKENMKNKKKAQLKSQCLKKSKTKLFEGFFIPDAKMTSSIIINTHTNTQMNKSTMMGGQKSNKANMDKSLQLKQKMEMTRLYQSQMCAILEPILKEARQIFTKNKQLIGTLKEGHKKQVELNLWMKEMRLADLKCQLRIKNAEYQREESQKDEVKTTEKNQSDTTGSPDQKQKNVSDQKAKQSNSDSKKLECQLRKKLLQEEKTFQQNMEENNHNMESKEHANKQDKENNELSPKEGRKISQKINRPSGYSRNKSLKIMMNEEMYQQSNLSNQIDTKMKSPISFNSAQEPSKQRIQEKIDSSKIILNESLKRSNLFDKFDKEESDNYQSSSKSKKSFKFDNIAKLEENPNLSYASRIRSRMTNVENVIHEEDEEKHYKSHDSSSSSEEELFEIHIKKPSNDFPHDQKLNLHHYPQPKVESSKGSLSSVNNQNQSKIFQQIPAKNQPNIFKNQKSISVRNSRNVFNTQNKENDSLSLNTNSQFVPKDSSQKNENPSQSFGSNVFSSSSGNFSTQKNQSLNQVQPFDHFTNPSQTFNQNPINQPTQNIFKKESTSPFDSSQNHALSKKNVFNVFQTDTNQQTNYFGPPSTSNVFNQAPSIQNHNFCTQRPNNNIFANNQSNENGKMFQQSNNQQNTIRITPNVFAPSYSSGSNGWNNSVVQQNSNVDIFGNPRNAKPSGAMMNQSPVKNDSGMRMEQRKQEEEEFFHY